MRGLDCLVFNLKRDPPVTAHRNAPCPSPVPGQLVHTPAWRSLHPVHVRREDQHSHNFTYAIDQITPDASVIVGFNKRPEPSMSHAADMHTYDCTSLPYRRKAF